MAGDQENSPVLHSNSSKADTSSINRKRKAEVLNFEPLAPREVNESMLKLQFEKKLTHSDVEGHDCILIPKAYVEIVFPEAMIKPWIYHMDDLCAAKVWTFLIRSSSRDSSKIYELEGVAEYIQEHGIKVGDYIKIYKDPELQRFAIGWRKHDGETDKFLGAANTEVALDDKNALPTTNYEVALVGKNAFNDTNSEICFADDYHPQTAPENETHQFNNDITIDPEYVQNNLNMSWDEFQDFNPFDFP